MNRLHTLKNASQPEALKTLLARPDVWRAGQHQQSLQCEQQHHHHIPSGFNRLDQALPGGGWPNQGAIELLCPTWASGEQYLITPLLAHLSREKRWLVWVAPPWQPYPAGLLARGIQLHNQLILQTESRKEQLWAMETCLNSGQCSLVMGWQEQLNHVAIKRLHMASLAGSAIALLLRPDNAAPHASPVPLRVQTATCHYYPKQNPHRPSTQHSVPLPQMGIKIRIIKRRGGWPSDWFELPLGTNPN